jgi:NADPH:quinone reductase-like Zn-dependent oxidoreductase
MKAVKFNEYGGTDVLRVIEVEAPHAGAGQVRIAVRAAGVNPIDWKLRAGYVRDFMPLTFPAGVGSEAAGIVDEVGDGVSGVAIGDAVFGYGQNTVAEQAVLRAWARIPDNMPIEVAGGLPVIVETATRILDHVNLKAGETLLIAGAAGGVGTAAIQLARHRGAIVIGTASEPKHDYIRKLGAIPTTYEPGLAARIRELAPQGVNAALDLAGAGVIPELVEIVGDPARRFHFRRHGAATWRDLLGAIGRSPRRRLFRGSAVVWRRSISSTHRANLPDGRNRPGAGG